MRDPESLCNARPLAAPNLAGAEVYWAMHGEARRARPHGMLKVAGRSEEVAETKVVIAPRSRHGEKPAIIGLAAGGMNGNGQPGNSLAASAPNWR
jgi:hypothetical protein